MTLIFRLVLVAISFAVLYLLRSRWVGAAFDGRQR